MNFRAPGDGSSEGRSPCDVQPHCPICDGRMETVYERAHQKVCQCVDCGTSLTVPAAAWTIATERRHKDPAA